MIPDCKANELAYSDLPQWAKEHTKGWLILWFARVDPDFCAKIYAAEPDECGLLAMALKYERQEQAKLDEEIRLDRIKWGSR